MKFRVWLLEQNDLPDYGEIEGIYDKAHVAVQIVKFYNPKLIENISTIANLASGAYGLHNANEKRQIKNGDTIHVNVQRILNQSKSNHDAIFQIASTIIHEATHEIEGSTDETAPMGEEQKFKQWAEQNMEKLHEMFPELQS